MRSMKILSMILAGGVGERLYPLTSQRCKPVVPFGGKFRIIDFTLMNCVASGLRQIYVLPQYHTQSLSHHWSERWNFLSRELGEYVELLPPKMRGSSGYYHGTADAIYRNLDLLDRHRPDVVLVLSGDHVYRADYMKFIEAHVEREADITVLTDWVDAAECTAFGVLTLGAGGRITGFVEKPADPSPYAIDGRCATNLGVYCFRTEFLVQQLVRDAKRKTAHDFGRNILPASVDHSSVLTCPLELISPDPQPYWRDVGTIDSYFETSMDLLRVPAPFSLKDPRWAPNSRFHEWCPALYTTTARIGNRDVHGRNLVSNGVRIEDSEVVNSVISPRVHIESGCEVEESILFEGVRIGRGSKLRKVIVEEGVTIPEGTTIGHGNDSREFAVSKNGVITISASYRFHRCVTSAPGPEVAEPVSCGGPTESCREPCSGSGETGSREPDASPRRGGVSAPGRSRARAPSRQVRVH